jgi:hypothetical protein
VRLFEDQVLDQFAPGTGSPIGAERKLGRARESHPDHRRHQPMAPSITKHGLVWAQLEYLPREEQGLPPVERSPPFFAGRMTSK